MHLAVSQMQVRPDSPICNDTEVDNRARSGIAWRGRHTVGTLLMFVCRRSVLGRLFYCVIKAIVACDHRFERRSLMIATIKFRVRVNDVEASVRRLNWNRALDVNNERSRLLRFPGNLDHL